MSLLPVSGRLWLAIIMIVLAGCAGLPVDTLNKRLAVFEIGYQQTLTTLQTWVDEGRLTGDTKKKIQDHVRDMENALAALYAAKAMGDLDTVDGQLRAAQASLQLVRDYITAQEGIP